MNDSTNNFELATLGGGCFWCLDAVYLELQGIKKVVSGYSGGSVSNPTYDAVCSGSTGHAEVVQLTFDPKKISYQSILEVFFTIHDPTTLNRQGNDVGTQYRSVIFTHSEEQKETAAAVIADVENSGAYRNPVVTQIEPLDLFYAAEDYHQDYYSNNSYQPYCQVVISPKLAKFRKKYVANLK